VKLGSRMKLVHSKFSRYFDFYVMSNSDSTIQIKGIDHKFDYKSF
jgi:hypothetical protein